MSEIAIKLPVLNNDEHKERLFQVARQHNNTVRFCYNRYKDNPDLSDTAINHIAKSTLKNIPDIDNAWVENCRKQAKAIFKSNKESKSKFRSGGFNAIKKRRNGLISHEEYRKLRNSSIYWEGSKNHHGNRKFKLVDSGHSIEFLITKNERYVLKLPKLHGSYKRYLEDLFVKTNKKEIAVCYNYNVLNGTICISFNLDKLYESEKIKTIKNRVLGIDLNPNQICISISDNGEKMILKESFILKNLKDKSKDKLKHEVLEISSSIKKIIRHYQIEVVAVEQLKMKSKDHHKGKNFNRLVNNFWIRRSFVENLKKHCHELGVHFQEVAPQYSSFIGQMNSPDEENGIAASMEIARRGLLFYKTFITKEIEKRVILFPKLDKGFLITRWKKFREMIVPCRSWVNLYDSLKNSKQSYRVFLKDIPNDRFEVFRFKSRRSCCETIVYT